MNPENFDIRKMMETARTMQKEMQKTHEKIANTEYTSEAKGVKIAMMGNYQVKQVHIKPTLLNEKPETLEAAIKEAVNQVITKIDRVSKEKLSDLSSQLGGGEDSDRLDTEY